MVLALSVGGTASGEDMPAGTSTAETAVKSAGKTGEITFPVGSYIVDMGNTSSDDAQLKPYGLIYDLVLNAKVPVYWVINGSKTSQTGVDLTYNGRNYISGPFVISGDDVDYNVRSMLSKWRGYGVSIDGPTDTRHGHRERLQNPDRPRFEERRDVQVHVHPIRPGHQTGR